MAAISLTFIILITPWTFKEVIEACTGTKVRATIKTTPHNLMGLTIVPYALFLDNLNNRKYSSAKKGLLSGWIFVHLDIAFEGFWTYLRAEMA